MLKKDVRLPSTQGNLSFLVKFENPLPAKRALFVIRPKGVGKEPDSNTKCALTWTNAAAGFFTYSPEVSAAKSVVSRRFDFDFNTADVEIEVIPWGEGEIGSKISDITLITQPSSSDTKFTTYIGE